MQGATGPSTNQPLGRVAGAGASDADAAVQAALAGFHRWRRVQPSGRSLWEAAVIISGTPMREMICGACGPAAAMQPDVLRDLPATLRDMLDQTRVPPGTAEQFTPAIDLLPGAAP